MTDKIRKPEAYGLRITYLKCPIVSNRLLHVSNPPSWHLLLIAGFFPDQRIYIYIPRYTWEVCMKSEQTSLAHHDAQWNNPLLSKLILSRTFVLNYHCAHLNWKQNENSWQFKARARGPTLPLISSSNFLNENFDNISLDAHIFRFMNFLECQRGIWRTRFKHSKRATWKLNLKHFCWYTAPTSFLMWI